MKKKEGAIWTKIALDSRSNNAVNFNFDLIYDVSL